MGAWLAGCLCLPDEGRCKLGLGDQSEMDRNGWIEYDSQLGVVLPYTPNPGQLANLE